MEGAPAAGPTGGVIRGEEGSDVLEHIEVFGKGLGAL